MKWCNRLKRVREEKWTKIEISRRNLDDEVTFILGMDVDKRIEWCKEQSSKGRFHYKNGAFWFEFDQDAMLFQLKW